MAQVLRQNSFNGISVFYESPCRQARIMQAMIVSNGSDRKALYVTLTNSITPGPDFIPLCVNRKTISVLSRGRGPQML
jgi:hypothetical protein